MIGELLKAIRLRWIAKAMGSVFVGGITEGQLPPVEKTTVLPLVSVDIIGVSSTGRASSDSSNQIQQYETVMLDFTVRARGGLSVCSGLVEQLKAVYSNMHATLGSGVSIKKFFWQGESQIQDLDHPNVWDWSITYAAVLEQSQTAVNV